MSKRFVGLRRFAIRAFCDSGRGYGRSGPESPDSGLRRDVDGPPLDTFPEALLLGLIRRCSAGFTAPFSIVSWRARLWPQSSPSKSPPGLCSNSRVVRVLHAGETHGPRKHGQATLVGHCADWLSDHPTCSAAMTRSYRDTFALPGWFFNLPPPDDAPHRGGYGAGELLVRADLYGFIDVRNEGTLEIVTGPGMGASVRIDGARLDPREPGRHQVSLPPGTHRVQVAATLATKHWPIVPTWNCHPIESMWFPATTIEPPSRFDRLLRPLGNWVLLLLCGLLAVWWLASWARQMDDHWLLAWSVGAAVAVSLTAILIPSEAAWYTAAVLSLSLLIVTPPRFHTARGAFLLIGVPWLAYFAAANLHQVGRWTLYGVGNDNFLFQRYCLSGFHAAFLARRRTSDVLEPAVLSAGLPARCTCSSGIRAWARCIGMPPASLIIAMLAFGSSHRPTVLRGPHRGPHPDDDVPARTDARVCRLRLVGDCLRLVHLSRGVLRDAKPPDAWTWSLPARW